MPHYLIKRTVDVFAHDQATLPRYGMSIRLDTSDGITRFDLCPVIRSGDDIATGACNRKGRIVRGGAGKKQCSQGDYFLFKTTNRKVGYDDYIFLNISCLFPLRDSYFRQKIRLRVAPAKLQRRFAGPPRESIHTTSWLTRWSNGLTRGLCPLWVKGGHQVNSPHGTVYRERNNRGRPAFPRAFNNKAT